MLKSKEHHILFILTFLNILRNRLNRTMQSFILALIIFVSSEEENKSYSIEMYMESHQICLELEYILNLAFIDEINRNVVVRSQCISRTEL